MSRPRNIDKNAIVVGLVGCGNWGQNILRDLKSLGCRVTVVARSAASQQRARRGKADKIVKPLDAIGIVDGYIVATPTTTHADVIEQILAINPKAHIFVEKPLTNNLRAARRIAKRAPNNIFVMDKWRYHPGIQELGRIAKSGKLGKVVGLKTLRVSWGTTHKDVDCIWTLAPHDIAIALEITGRIPDPISAIADMDKNQPKGLIAVLGKDPWFHLEVSERYPVYKRDTRLFLEKGVAILDDGYADFVQVIRSKSVEFSKPDIQRIPIAKTMPLLTELESFVSYLQGGPAPKSSVKEALLAVETISKLRKLAGIND